MKQASKCHTYQNQYSFDKHEYKISENDEFSFVSKEWKLWNKKKKKLKLKLKLKPLSPRHLGPNPKPLLLVIL